MLLPMSIRDFQRINFPKGLRDFPQRYVGITKSPGWTWDRDDPKTQVLRIDMIEK